MSGFEFLLFQVRLYKQERKTEAFSDVWRPQTLRDTSAKPPHDTAWGSARDKDHHNVCGCVWRWQPCCSGAESSQVPHGCSFHLLTWAQSPGDVSSNQVTLKGKKKAVDGYGVGQDEETEVPHGVTVWLKHLQIIVRILSVSYFHSLFLSCPRWSKYSKTRQAEWWNKKSQSPWNFTSFSLSYNMGLHIGITSWLSQDHT